PGGVIYRSMNRGRSWAAMSEGLRGSLLTLHNAPRERATVYAVTTQEIFGTVDAARTWTARNGQGASGFPPNVGLRGLAVAPSAPSTLYVVAQTRANPVPTGDGRALTF